MKKTLILLLLCSIITFSHAQPKQRQVNNQTQSWISINNTVRVSKHWGFVADVHYRANQIFASPNLYVARTGVSYWLDNNISITAGYAHLWLAPTVTNWHTYSNENRIYQQVQVINKYNKFSIVSRLRNEQRWQEKIVNDTSTHTNKFTNRIRFLEQINIPLFKNPKLPVLVLSDELSVQTGKEVVYNIFDQNRIFIGFKQQIKKNLLFDIGYMLVDQQKSTGYQFDQNHTFRLFFYFNPDLSKQVIR